MENRCPGSTRQEPTPASSYPPPESYLGKNDEEQNSFVSAPHWVVGRARKRRLLINPLTCPVSADRGPWGGGGRAPGRLSGARSDNRTREVLLDELAGTVALVALGPAEEATLDTEATFTAALVAGGGLRTGHGQGNEEHQKQQLLHFFSPRSRCTSKSWMPSQ